jgi:hypothetical protein
MNLKIIISGLLTALTIFAYAQASVVSPINFVVEPYLQQVNDNSFHLLWETSQPGKGTVKLGVAEFNVLKPKLDQVFREETTGVFHRIVVNGLKVDEHYFYQAMTIGEKGDTLLGTVTPLHIPDYKQMPVSFAVIGDTQGNPKVWGRLAELIYLERPNFLIHVGDLVSYGPHKDDWVDEFFKPARNIFRFYPLYPAIGNHEMNHDWFYRYFDLPENEWFYTVKKGDVLLIFADTNRDILPGSDQYRKLTNILASSHETWKIMVHHHPVYTSDEKGFGNTWFQRQVHGDPNQMHLKKLYETYGVDLVLNGHMHLYERTWPIASDKTDVKNGVTYVTLGGGGGHLDPSGANRTWYAAKTRNTHHFLNVDILGNTLLATAIDSAGIPFDSWRIEKEAGYQRLNAPQISGTKEFFTDSTTVSIQNLNSKGNILYQLTDNQVNGNGKNEAKIVIHETTTVKAYVQEQAQKSIVAEKLFVKLPVLPALKKANKGVKAIYVEGDWIALPDFTKLPPLKTFELDSVSLQLIQPRAQDHFAVRFSGSFSVPENDVYRFLLESFDGSKLFIDGQEIISNDGIHYEIRKENFVALEKGTHSFEIHYFDFVRRETLKVWIGAQSGPMKWLNSFIVKQ